MKKGFTGIDFKNIWTETKKIQSKAGECLLTENATDEFII